MVEKKKNTSVNMVREEYIFFFLKKKKNGSLRLCFRHTTCHYKDLKKKILTTP